MRRLIVDALLGFVLLGLAVYRVFIDEPERGGVQFAVSLVAFGLAAFHLLAVWGALEAHASAAERRPRIRGFWRVSVVCALTVLAAFELM